jgi:excisionase family DNA binding protein
MANEIKNFILYLEKEKSEDLNEDVKSYLLDVFIEFKVRKNAGYHFQQRVVRIIRDLNYFRENFANFLRPDGMNVIRQEYPLSFETIKKEDRTIKIHTVAEAAKILRISKPAVYNLIKEGKVTGMKIKLPHSSRPAIRIDDEDLREYIRSTKVSE